MSVGSSRRRRAPFALRRDDGHSDDVPWLTTSKTHDWSPLVRSAVGRASLLGDVSGARSRHLSSIGFSGTRMILRGTPLPSSSQFMLKTIVLLTASVQLVTMFSQHRFQLLNVTIHVRLAGGFCLPDEARISPCASRDRRVHLPAVIARSFSKMHTLIDWSPS